MTTPLPLRPPPLRRLLRTLRLGYCRVQQVQHQLEQNDFKQGAAARPRHGKFVGKNVYARKTQANLSHLWSSLPVFYFLQRSLKTPFTVSLSRVWNIGYYQSWIPSKNTHDMPPRMLEGESTKWHRYMAVTYSLLRLSGCRASSGRSWPTGYPFNKKQVVSVAWGWLQRILPTATAKGRHVVKGSFSSSWCTRSGTPFIQKEPIF